MTKREAYEWLRRAREGLQDLRKAIETGDVALFDEAIVEATAAPEEVRAAYEDGTLAGFIGKTRSW